MTPPPRKKLIEVALPLKAINEAAAREKSIRHGHPSTLHLWWARRPLAACRAVLFASLVDDPDSEPIYQDAKGKPDEERAAWKRTQLFRLIEELVQWENSNDRPVLHSARAEIARCVANRLAETGKLKRDAAIAPGVTVKDIIAKGHCRPVEAQDKKTGKIRWRFDTAGLPPFDAVNAFLAEHAPPVLDPFCGGGSIPLEAQRLGLRAFASDLNPVPVLITKALIEIPPKFAGRPPVNPAWQKKSDAEKKATIWEGARGLAEDVRYYGRWMRDEAEKRIGHLYPKVKITAAMAKDRPDLKDYVGHELTVIAWLWARTVECPNPACKAHTPIAKTFELSGKEGNKACAEPFVNSKTKSVSFKVGRSRESLREGNVNRKGARCLICATPISLDHIRDEATYGRMGQQMMAIIAEGRRNRVYLSPTIEQIDAALKANEQEAWSPSTQLPVQALGFRVQRYGMTTHASLFSKRQIVALSNLAQLVQQVAVKQADGANHDYFVAVATYLSFAISKAANYWSSLCSWYVAKEIMVSTFGLPTLSMVWDFAEANPFSDSSGNWMLGVEQAASGLDGLFSDVVHGHVSQLDAVQHPMTGMCEPIISTDPPYYDNIGYANLSDFFYVWLRRCLMQQYPMLFITVLTPKDSELIAEPGRFENVRDRAVEHFETGASAAFGRFREGSARDYPMTVYYAFKQQETEGEAEGEEQSILSSGWEKMLASLMASGHLIVGTWPIRTEQSGGLREAKCNALASSIVLVCRPRPENAAIATRKQFTAELRESLPKSLRDLQHGNIAPVDLAQAAIGPGMAVFTKFAKVVEPNGSAMTVRTALGIINQVLDETLAEQEGEFDADTRWALAWFEQFGMNPEAFGTAETLSRAKGTAMNGLEKAGIVKAKGGKVQLLARTELPEDWDPATDGRLTVWETVQHLIRVLEGEGEAAAAALVGKLGGLADTARDLAYRLYAICERKKWADEARAYNGLVIAWPELLKLSIRAKPATTPDMFER